MIRQTRRYNTIVIDKLSQKHKVTKVFVRQCIRGDRTSLTAELIAKEYKKMVFEVEQILNK